MDIRELTKNVKTKNVFHCSVAFKSYGSGELVRKQEKEGMGGNPLYRKCQKQCTFASTKDYEQLMKLGTPLEEAEIKNRFEDSFEK